MTFADFKRLFRAAAERPRPPSNVTDLAAERAKRWLAKHTRPMPLKDAA